MGHKQIGTSHSKETKQHEDGLIATLDKTKCGNFQEAKLLLRWVSSDFI